MIVEKKTKINGRDFIRRYSDEDFYLEREESLYEEALDPYELKDERIYTETDIPIDKEEVEEVAEEIEEDNEEETSEEETEE